MKICIASIATKAKSQKASPGVRSRTPDNSIDRMKPIDSRLTKVNWRMVSPDMATV